MNNKAENDEETEAKTPMPGCITCSPHEASIPINDSVEEPKCAGLKDRLNMLSCSHETHDSISTTLKSH